MLIFFFFLKFLIIIKMHSNWRFSDHNWNGFQMLSQITQIMAAHWKTHSISLGKSVLFQLKIWNFLPIYSTNNGTMFFFGPKCERETTHKSTYHRRLRWDEFHSRQCSRNYWTLLKWIAHTNADAQHKQFFCVSSDLRLNGRRCSLWKQKHTHTHAQRIGQGNFSLFLLRLLSFSLLSLCFMVSFFFVCVEMPWMLSPGLLFLFFFFFFIFIGTAFLEISLALSVNALKQ